MRSASYLPSSDPRREPLRRRAIALLLALAAHILIVIVLLRLTPATTPALEPPEPTSFQMLPEPSTAPTPAPRAKSVAKVKRPSGGAAPRAPVSRGKPAIAAPTPPVPFPAMIPLDLASSDISKMPSHADDSEAEGEGSGSGKDSGSAYGPGEGPGGERLYNAEWYREPTHAELAYNLPAGGPRTGWGLIACKTIANYRVENCRTLGESPLGSGLARAVRLAAWQFRIRPPRIGGRPVIGAWVRIRIDWTEGVPSK